MTPLVSLWLPILLSAVGVFLVSSALHMFTGWHKSDYLKVPNEDRVMDTLDRKSTRLNSSHSQISYAVFCLKKKRTTLPVAPGGSSVSEGTDSVRLRRRAGL